MKNNWEKKNLFLMQRFQSYTSSFVGDNIIVCQRYTKCNGETLEIAIQLQKLQSIRKNSNI